MQLLDAQLAVIMAGDKAYKEADLQAQAWGLMLYSKVLLKPYLSCARKIWWSFIPLQMLLDQSPSGSQSPPCAGASASQWR